MAARKNRPEVITVPTVPAGKEKLTFKLVVEGEWDWNRDIAGPAHESLVGGYRVSRKSLSQAILDGLANRIFDRCDNMFTNVRLLESSINSDMEAAFQTFTKACEKASRTEKEQALALAEEQAARLRQELFG